MALTRRQKEFLDFLIGFTDSKGYSPSYEEIASALDLASLATVHKHVNVLQHIVGYFKSQLTTHEKAELLGLIADYHRGLTPLIVPLTLVKHYVQILDVGYVRDQVYLSPHPKELMLRNHA